MASSCDAAVPYTLLGALLSGGGGGFGGRRAFLRDYAQRGTNALLWVALLAVTWILVRRISALLRLWALGSRLPGPPALLTDAGLATVCRAGGDITGLGFVPLFRIAASGSTMASSASSAAITSALASSSSSTAASISAVLSTTASSPSTSPPPPVLPRDGRSRASPLPVLHGPSGLGLPPFFGGAFGFLPDAHGASAAGFLLDMHGTSAAGLLPNTHRVGGMPFHPVPDLGTMAAPPTPISIDLHSGFHQQFKTFM